MSVVAVGGDAVLGGEGRADEDIPVHDVGVDAALFGHGENRCQNVCHSANSASVSGQASGKRGIANHQRERVKTP